MPKEYRIGVRALRAKLAHVLEDVEHGGGAYVVERGGEPVAAVVSLPLYRQLGRRASGTPPVARKVAETAAGPYDALLALAGTMPSEHTDVGRHKRRHLAEIYGRQKRRS